MRLVSRHAALVLAATMGIALALPTHAFEIPQPLETGHHELYERLEEATQAGGRTGGAARASLTALQGHFEKEERYALPQLGALPALAAMPGRKEGDLTAEQKRDLVARTERFRAELPQMLKEHEEISAALEDLQKAAEAEGKEQVARLAQEIMTHAKTEELVLYPAALLIGNHVKTTVEGKR